MTIVQAPSVRWGRPSGVFAVVTLALILAACGPGEASAVGVVVAIDPTASPEVTGFTLRTSGGETLRFEIGPLDLDSGAFAATHLREHLATSQPIAVAYRVESDGRRVAHRLVDAPWFTP